MFYLKSVKCFLFKRLPLYSFGFDHDFALFFQQLYYLFAIDLFLFWLVQKRLVLQVKELSITGTKIHEDFAQIVTKSISNVGNLKLSKCKITKSAVEEFRTALKDKLVSKI